MIKLNLAQNAYHTLHHAIEHLALTRWSGDFDSEKRFDHDAHMIEWTESGSLCFYIQEGYVRPPRTYNLKFALLLLVQACELFLKAHIEQIDKSYLFVRVGSRKTISLNMALQLVIKWETHFLTPDEVALLLRAKDIRSDLEHFELTYPSEI